MDSLDLRGLATVIDLLDAIVLGSGGIHLVVTDRPIAVRKQLAARLPEGWTLAELFDASREGLSSAVYEDQAHGSVVLFGAVEPAQARENAILRALNTDREWLLRKRRCAVVLVAGEGAAGADAAYIQLQAQAPDFWSVRNRVHRLVHEGSQPTVAETMLDRLVTRFGGDRRAAARWLDGRVLEDDWINYRLWRDGPSQQAWLALAKPASVSQTVEDSGRVRASLEAMDSSSEPTWSSEPIGEPIDPERWPQPSWPAGKLESTQQALVAAMGVDLDGRGRSELAVLPEEEQRTGALDEAVLTLGLLRRSRYERVVHLDAHGGLEAAIVWWLDRAGSGVSAPGLIHALRRLRAALGTTESLLLLTGVSASELLFMRAVLGRRPLVASRRSATRHKFCVLTSHTHEAVARQAREALSPWPRGATIHRIKRETAVLDLRDALAEAEYVVLLLDSTWASWPSKVWHPLTVASGRGVGFSIGEGPHPEIEAMRWLGELGGGDAGLERLRGVARDLAGEPMSVRAIDDALTRAFELSVRALGSAFGTTPAQEAADATREAVELYRRLTDQHPDPLYVGNELARELVNLGSQISALGSYDEAVTITREGIKVYQELIELHPHVFIGNLAWPLTNLGTYYRHLGRRDEARQVAQEAIDIHRELAQVDPDRYVPELVRSLRILGNIHHDAREYPRALDAFVEASTLLLPLLERHPMRFKREASRLAQGVRRASEDGELSIPEPVAAMIASILDGDSASSPG